MCNRILSGFFGNLYCGFMYGFLINNGLQILISIDQEMLSSYDILYSSCLCSHTFKSQYESSWMIDGYKASVSARYPKFTLRSSVESFVEEFRMYYLSVYCMHLFAANVRAMYNVSVDLLGQEPSVWKM